MVGVLVKNAPCEILVYAIDSMIENTKVIST